MRRNKYRNTPTIVDGIRFDSKREAKRYGELLQLARGGYIADLIMQPAFPIIAVNETSGEPKKVATYKADFSYIQEGAQVVEDVKSPATAKNPTYRLKKKLVEHQYGIEIVEV